MKVYFIGDLYDSCYYVRCLLPLRENGWDGAKTALYRNYVDPDTMFRGAMNSDIIVFQRPMDRKKYDAAQLMKMRGKKIVMDNDDTYKENSGTPAVMIYGAKKYIKKINRNLVDFAKISDLVTVTTKFLANEYLEYNKNVEVLPNLIDPDDWDEPLEKNNEKVRIGLVGSVLTSGDFFVIKDIIPKLLENDKIQLVLFGLKKELFNQKDSLVYKLYEKEINYWKEFLDKVEFHDPVSINEYMTFLNELKLDIVLMPRQDNYFNRCKSNLKFLEASMVEALSIVSGFSDNNSPYEQNPEDKNYEIIVKDDSKWLDIILYYVNNEKERKEIAKKAREYVIQSYNIKTKGRLWEEAYKKIYA